MRLRSITSAALSLSLLLLGTAASALDPGCRLIRGAATPETTDDVEVCRVDTWLHGGETKLGNLAGAGQGTIPTWNTTQPTASLQEGAGAGYAQVRFVEIVSPRDKRVTPTMEGTFTGVLDNLAATIYLACPIYQGGNYPMSVALTIDGEPVVDRMALNTFVEVPLVGVTDAYGVMKIAFTNLYETLKMLGMDNTSTTTHTIEIQFMNQFWVDGNAVMLYDATDFPTGNIFNIETNKLGPYKKLDTLAEGSG